MQNGNETEFRRVVRQREVMRNSHLLKEIWGYVVLTSVALIALAAGRELSFPAFELMGGIFAIAGLGMAVAAGAEMGKLMKKERQVER